MKTVAPNTPQVTERRRLQFNTIDEVMEEIDRIEAAERAGTLRPVGNWTPGQNLGHVAAWIDYGYEGFPMKPPPWLVRIILKRMLKKYLRQGMPTGVRIPRVKEGTYGIERLTTAEGADRLRRAFARLKSDESAKFDSPAFGPMSHADRIRLNLRHAELHLGFLVY